MSRFVTISLHLIAAFVMAGCASRVTPREGHTSTGLPDIFSEELPPLELTDEHKNLLASVSSPPKTALDYYMLLPKSCFSIMPDSPERRITYVDRANLSDDYLHARRWFEMAQEGFEFRLRLFKTPSGPIIALLKGLPDQLWDEKPIYAPMPKGGNLAITMRKPVFWRYISGAWIAQESAILPNLPPSAILDHFNHHYKAHIHEQYHGQSEPESISLEYTFFPTTTDIDVTGDIADTGRDGLFDPAKSYVWKRYRWTGKRFVAR